MVKENHKHLLGPIFQYSCELILAQVVGLMRVLDLSVGFRAEMGL
jgi:hypothetical protein